MEREAEAMERRLQEARQNLLAVAKEVSCVGLRLGVGGCVWMDGLMDGRPVSHECRYIHPRPLSPSHPPHTPPNTPPPSTQHNVEPPPRQAGAPPREAGRDRGQTPPGPARPPAAGAKGGGGTWEAIGV